MAKFENSAIFGQVRGRVGNIVYSRNRYGLYVKEYVKPYDAKTPKQMKTREKMRFLGHKWRNLTQKEAKIWCKRAEFETVKGKKLSGYMLFCRYIRTTEEYKNL